MPALYHFTSIFNLPRIVQDGYLKLVESEASQAKPRAGRSVVWLTENPQLKRALQYGTNRPGTIHDKSRVRFGADAGDAVRWVETDEYAGMEPAFRASMVSLAGGPAEANRYWVTYSTIARSQWVSVTVDAEPLPLGGSAFGADRLLQAVERFV